VAAFRNATKARARAEERADLRSELEAITAGTWPRTIDDLFRWGGARTSPYLSARENQRIVREHAASCCRRRLAYLDGVERRLAAGDPDLKGWEGWKPCAS
jgi:hypothetical protein